MNLMWYQPRKSSIVIETLHFYTNSFFLTSTCVFLNIFKVSLLDAENKIILNIFKGFWSDLINLTLFT